MLSGSIFCNWPQHSRNVECRCGVCQAGILAEVIGLHEMTGRDRLLHEDAISYICLIQGNTHLLRHIIRLMACSAMECGE